MPECHREAEEDPGMGSRKCGVTFFRQNYHTDHRLEGLDARLKHKSKQKPGLAWICDLQEHVCQVFDVHYSFPSSERIPHLPYMLLIRFRHYYAFPFSLIFILFIPRKGAASKQQLRPTSTVAILGVLGSSMVPDGIEQVLALYPGHCLMIATSACKAGCI